jgi:probable HAF family extracellular repeat protein
MKRRHWAILTYLLIFLLVSVSAVLPATYRFVTIDYPGALWTIATGINNQGQIVGGCQISNDSGPGFLLDQSGFHIFLFPEVQFTFPNKINNLGQIVGAYYDANGEHGFLKDGDNYLTIAYPGVPVGNALGINDQGQIVGYYGDSEHGITEHGFLKTGSAYTTVDYPLYPDGTWIVGINNQGHILGTYGVPAGDHSISHGFLKVGNQYSDVFFPGANETVPWGMNNLDQIVGSIETPTVEHGFIWEPAGNYSVGIYTQIDFPGAPATRAWGINDKGQIVGVYWDSDGISHGFLAEPIKNSSAINLLLLD